MSTPRKEAEPGAAAGCFFVLACAFTIMAIVFGYIAVATMSDKWTWATVWTIAIAIFLGFMVKYTLPRKGR